MSDAYVFCSSGTGHHIYYTHTFTCCYTTINHIFMKLLALATFYRMLLLGALFFSTSEFAVQCAHKMYTITSSSERRQTQFTKTFNHSLQLLSSLSLSLSLSNTHINMAHGLKNENKSKTYTFLQRYT